MMRISGISGEFSLIGRFAKRQTGNDIRILKGVGDDCAVLDAGNGRCQLVTADMMVENDYFNTEWFTPKQIGKKLVECNVSDIVAMGSDPD